MAGLMIDDFLLIEAVRPEEDASMPREADDKIREVRAAYEKVKLPRHEGKSVSGAEEGSFWAGRTALWENWCSAAKLEAGDSACFLGR